ncbi:MAG: fluoride efflux transporter CrcB [Alistipes sp.]
MIRELLAVGCGGAVGSIARYLLSYYTLAGHTLFGFPAGTFAVNLIGSLLIGILLSVLDSATFTWLLVIGFCGGFTTFSTFSADVVRLLQAGSYLAAALYILASVVCCVVCVAGGLWIGQVLKIN